MVKRFMGVGLAMVVLSAMPRLSSSQDETVPGKSIGGQVLYIDDYGSSSPNLHAGLLIRQIDNTYAFVYFLQSAYKGMDPISDGRATRILTMAATSPWISLYDVTREANAWWAPYYVVRQSYARVSR